MTRLNLYAIWATACLSAVCCWKAHHNSYGEYFVQAMDTIHSRGLKEIDRQTLFDAAIEGMARKHDQHSDFISRTRRDRYVGELDQHFSGIGIVAEMDQKTQSLVVVTTIVGSPRPALDAGMRSGDRIVAIEGEPVSGKPLNEAIASIRGPTGVPVSITVIHEDDQTSEALSVVRADIAVDSLLGDHRKPDGDWEYRLTNEPRIAHFRLTEFGDLTASELTAALEVLQTSGLLHAAIIDVRDNSGGYLPAALDICDTFITKGKIVTTRGRKGAASRVDRAYSATPENTYADIPLVVLVNSESASASEIFAACMQDQHRAKIIGTRTYGKGSVQQMFPMERNRSLLKLTTATYWRPSGRNIHRGKNAKPEDEWGVKPDDGAVIALTDEQNIERSRQRRLRDAYRPDGPAGDFDKLMAADVQLQAAIEVLRAELDK